MPAFAIVVPYARAVRTSIHPDDAQDEAAAKAVKKHLDQDIKAAQARQATVLVNIYEDYIRDTQTPVIRPRRTELRVSD